MLQLWLIAGAIVAVAALLSVSITGLRGHADRARQVQLLVTDLNADAQHVSRIEWQVASEGRLSKALREDFQMVDRRIDARLREYERNRPSDGYDLRRQAHRYVEAVEKELALHDARRVAQAKEFDERMVDPSFNRLQRRLQVIDAAESNTARQAAGWADLGVTVSLLLAALVLIVGLWRLDRIRGAAARKRRQDLEVQALHDALTGLPNRRKLLVDLERALLRAEAGERHVLVLCDLDGFKAYNDTFGHPEGDLLLGRLSEKLAGAVAPYGAAYRLGGDEFCALLRVDDDELEAALAACHAALCESGSGFDIRASIGSVALGEEASDSSTALRLADQRMYTQKNDRGSSARQQLRDVILRVHAEQNPALHDHVNDVAGLTVGVGRRLGLDDAQVAHLVRAAELHDVGKVAIPDSILYKRGPLDADEHNFMQRHTLIGESILSAAPALAGVGRLVRSSHERYDGTGYPDGLREEEIPLSSRIIFVCDSFHAMTTDRPYRQAMNEGDALTELKRCSGSQFDPAVIDAFVTELAARNTAHHDVGEEQGAPEPAAVA